MWKRWTKKQRTEHEKKLDEYWKEAKKHVKLRSDDLANPDWYAFAWDSDARWEWELYFAWRIGEMPAGMKYLKAGMINTFFVPCEKPQDFDGTYKA